MSAEGAGPAIVSDHPFIPVAQWWTVCRICRLAEAAHTVTSLAGVDRS